eukprot:676297-Amorphochlora_amoeboformis.AAC.1
MNINRSLISSTYLLEIGRSIQTPKSLIYDRNAVCGVCNAILKVVLERPQLQADGEVGYDRDHTHKSGWVMGDKSIN